jgi:2-(1,2-epoxy-1,2-dihydrophenyl)acetyl-CoA isomerase
VEFRSVRYECRDDVATLTLDDPATLNAVSPAMAEEIAAGVERAAGEARALVLTGSGRGFCSGLNLSSLDLDPEDPELDLGILLDSHFNPLMRQFRNLPIPVVTAVNGVAAGVGCSLALVGDIILAARSARFIQAFRNIGLVPDGGSAFLLVHSIGRARASEMMLTGDKIEAEQAAAWGMINRVVEDAALADAAREAALRLARGPTRALAMIRRLCWDATEQDFDTMLERERACQRDAGRTADFREGIAAFIEKRPARFTGR